MSTTAGDFVMERLIAWGVRRIYGYPGDGINGLVSAIDRTDGKIEFIQVRHEEQAAFMATAHARLTGELGVCLATSGPGAIHLLNGLYDAKMDHQPVLAIAGQTSTMAIGGSYQQEVNLEVLFSDVASDFCHSITNPVAVRHVIDRAVRTAIARRTVTCVIVPKDVTELDAVKEPPREHNTVHSGIGYSVPRVIPHDADLQRAAAVLNAGKRVAMLVGAGAMGATDDVIAVADRLGAGCAKALLGKAVLPDDLDWVTGTIGILGTAPSNDMMNECDTLLMVGSNFPYAEFLPEEGKARGVQIDLDGKNVGLRFPMEVNLTGDAADTLRALLPLLNQNTDTSWRERIASKRKTWKQDQARRASAEATPMNPQIVFTELSPRLPDNCILTGDAGTATNWMGPNLEMRRGMKFAVSGGLATMGCAVPYAIAAKFEFPERVAIALTGDGAMQMNGINELITVAKYWRQWSDPRIIFLVLNNRDLSQVSWEMRFENGDRKFPASQDLPDFPYARFAELLGFKGIRVDDPGAIGAAWDAALSADRPVILEACTDSAVWASPPHIMPKQANMLKKAMSKGDPDAEEITHESAGQPMAAVFQGAGQAEG